MIIDTAGRLHIDENFDGRAEKCHEAINRMRFCFVVDAMTGQDAVNVAESFHQQLELTGVVLTKLDGDTRGGAAIIRQSGNRLSDQVRGYGRENGCARAISSGPDGFTNSRHGRYAYLDRESASWY